MGKKRKSKRAKKTKPNQKKKRASSNESLPREALLAPLRVMICGKSSFRQCDEYVEAIVRAFNGSDDDGGYLASGDDLDVDTRWFSDCPAHTADLHLNGALHTFIVILANAELADDVEYRKWLEEALRLVQDSNGRHRILVLAENETTVESFTSRSSTLASAQFLPTHALGEQAVRAAYFGLILLNESGRMVARHLDTRSACRQQLFISHAKKDGLPLALAILKQLDELPRLAKFYDARSLQLTDDWRRDLEQGIASSVVIVIRTGEYDNRPYCVAELRWADQYGCPVVVVDASNRLSRPRTDLPLSDAVTVVMRDGNSLRVIYAALREGLRSILLCRQVTEMKQVTEAQQADLLKSPVAVLHRMPTIASVRQACLQLAADPVNAQSEKRGVPTIVYPGPVMADERAESLIALADYFLPDTRIQTVGQLMTTAGVTA